MDVRIFFAELRRADHRIPPRPIFGVREFFAIVERRGWLKFSENGQIYFEVGK
jgi:hypothetical protein